MSGGERGGRRGRSAGRGPDEDGEREVEDSRGRGGREPREVRRLRESEGARNTVV